MSITAYKVEAVGHDRTGEDYGYVNIMYRYGSRQPCPRPDQCEKMEAIFWSGKRKALPSLMSGKYCPHFVVIGTTEYLGVCFLDGTECTFDEPTLGNAQPLYPDTIDYAPLENNAEFLIYEGANAVGKGRVLGRTIPYKVKPQRK